jgi:hypothetical protein
MRYGYWFDAVMGLILIATPYVGRFAQDRTALTVDWLVGLALVGWAIASSWTFSRQTARRTHATQV